MNIHEYQAKAVLKEFGVPVPRGKAVVSAEEAEAAAKELGGPVWVVKSQIHAGGRGKGKFKEADAGEKGGVRLAKSIDEVKQFAQQMLGKTLVTIQTGEAGKDIEAVAHDTPEKIITFSIDPATGVMPHHGRTVAKALGLKGPLAKEAEDLTAKLYQAFLAKDMEMLEINPLIVTKDGHLRCLDAKISFDSNAL